MHLHLLFIGNAIAHWVSAMSGIVSLSLGIVEYFRKQKTEAVILGVVAILFLFVSCDQAWQDEHRNAVILTAEKSVATGESAFWKEQSYAKDMAIRSRDQLLAQNYGALIGEQSTANNAESALAKLSDKILDIGKPQPLSTVVHPLTIPHGDGIVKVRYFIAVTNKTVNPAYLDVICDQDITAGEGVVVGAAQPLMGIGPVVSKRRFGLSFTAPPWSPLSPALIDVHYDGKEPNCSVEVVR